MLAFSLPAFLVLGIQNPEKILQFQGGWIFHYFHIGIQRYDFKLKRNIHCALFHHASVKR